MIGRAPLLVDIAFAHLRGRVRQTVISVLGVTMGVGFSIAMAALMEGSQRDFVTKLVDVSPHIVVKDEFRDPPRQPVQRLHPGGAIALRGLRPKVELRGIRNAKARIAELDRIAGAAVAPTLTGQVVIRYAGRDLGATVVGIDIERERRVSTLPDDITAGSIEALRGAANAIILGEGAARRLSAKPGDLLSVTSPAGTLLRMKVVGLFRTGVVSIDDGRVYTLLKKAQILQNRPNVIDQIRLRLENPHDARRLARIIERRTGYRTESWQEANESLLEVFVIRNAIMYTVVGAILLVASFGIFNVVSTITHEKARDIAILKSLGFRERDIRLIFLLEGVVLGALGSVLGWALGYGLTRAMAAVRFELRDMIEITHLPIYYSAAHYLTAAGFALGAAALAGYLPARKAARLHPVDIIRGAA